MIEFKPGYYEWHLIVNGNIMFTFDDFSKSLPDEVTEESACDLADELMNVMQGKYKEHGDTITQQLFIDCTQVIADTIYNHYK